MDYFQGVVTEYLRAKREVFVNTEFLIQLDPGDVQVKGRSWYCDAVAVSFRDSAVYLCEITYSSSMHALITRLRIGRCIGLNFAPLSVATLEYRKNGIFSLGSSFRKSTIPCSGRSSHS